MAVMLLHLIYDGIWVSCIRIMTRLGLKDGVSETYNRMLNFKYKKGINMARGINKVIIVGNLGNDPEVRYTPGGAAVTTISLATTENWKDKEGNRQEKTEWHRVVFFGRLAEIAGEYLKKGRQVYVEGKLRTNKWKDQSGADRYTTEILANEMQMLGGQAGGGGGQFGGQQSNQQSGYGGGAPSAPRPSAPSGSNQSQNNAPVPDFDDFDDEIPF